MQVSEQLRVDFVLVGPDRGEIHVLTQLRDDATGRVVGSAERTMVPLSTETRDKIMGLIKADAEAALKAYETIDKLGQPPRPAEDAIVVDGKELRPALEAVPAIPATTKKPFADRAVTWEVRS